MSMVLHEQPVSGRGCIRLTFSTAPCLLDQLDHGRMLCKLIRRHMVVRHAHVARRAADVVAAPFEARAQCGMLGVLIAACQLKTIQAESA
jgi:hypothetical protein